MRNDSAIQREERPRPIHHFPPVEPAEDAQGYMGSLVLRELLALPPAVLNAPVFRKVQNYLKHYRKTMEPR